MKHYRKYVTLGLLILFALACELPALPMDDDAFSTAVAQTVVAGLTEKYVSPTFTSTPTLTFTPSLTPTLPTETPTLPPTITPTFTISPTVTATLDVPLNKLIVTVHTNCRTGPDKSFPVAGTLLKGENAAVHGMDPTGRYFYIENPDPGSQYCWLSGKYAVVSGSVALVPVLTAMPTYTATPTATIVPGFNMVFWSLESCGSWWVNMELINTGKTAFKSVLIKMTEPFKGSTLVTGGNSFWSVYGCNTNKLEFATLEPGDSVVVSTSSYGRDLTGVKVIITVSVCAELDGAPPCLTKTLTFKPK